LRRIFPRAATSSLGHPDMSLERFLLLGRLADTVQELLPWA
jgi:hypothetical protein